MYAYEVAEYVESLAPRETAISGDEFRLVFGRPEALLKGVGVCWWATASAIEHAAELGLNVLLVHEQIFTYEQKSPWYKGPLSGGKPSTNGE